MKKIIVCLALVIALVAPPTLVTAQLLPGLPSLPGMPAFNMPSNVAVGNPSVYGGWVTSAGPVTYLGEDTATGQFGMFDYRVSALYLGASLPFAVGSDWGSFILTVAGTVPEGLNGTEHDYDAPGDYYAQWKPETYWGTAEGLWALPVFRDSPIGASLLSGFRYDCWQTSWKNPTPGVPPVGHAATDTAFLTVNAYIPFLGLMTSAGGLNVGAIGFPYVIGDALHTETLAGDFARVSGTFNRGYFFEVFAECELPPPASFRGSDLSLSLFAKFSAIEAKSDATGEITSPPAPTTTQDADFTFRRKLLVMGAKGTLKFNWAGLLPF